MRLFVRHGINGKEELAIQVADSVPVGWDIMKHLACRLDLESPFQIVLYLNSTAAILSPVRAGMVVCGGDRERDVQSTAAVLNEIGVGGLSVEVATDNEAALKSLVERGLAASSARGYHWRNISEARPQAKGIERAVCIMKEGIYANWLALERHCNARIALESPLLGYLVRHVYRTYKHIVRERLGAPPLERLREKRGGQAPRSYPFGAVGFLKPIHPAKWPGQRLVLCHFLGMRYVTGGGCLGYPFSVDAEGYREVIKGHSFKLKEPLQYDVESLFPLLAGVRPQDFPEPRLEAPQAEQALPPPDFPPELDPPVLPREEVSPHIDSPTGSCHPDHRKGGRRKKGALWLERCWKVQT